MSTLDGDPYIDYRVIIKEDIKFNECAAGTYKEQEEYVEALLKKTEGLASLFQQGLTIQTSNLGASFVGVRVSDIRFKEGLLSLINGQRVVCIFLCCLVDLNRTVRIHKYLEYEE